MLLVDLIDLGILGYIPGYNDDYSKEDFICSLENWYNYIEEGNGEGDYIRKTIDSLNNEDWDGFKKGLMIYLEKQGYKKQKEALSNCSLDFLSRIFKS